MSGFHRFLDHHYSNYSLDSPRLLWLQCLNRVNGWRHFYPCSRQRCRLCSTYTWHQLQQFLLRYLFQLLYSLYSLACVINPQYSNPQSFDHVFDIFSTQSLTSAHLIEYQFGQLTPQNESHFAYDSQQLNNSASDISQSLSLNHPTTPGYLLAVLQAYNATGSGGNNSDSGDPGGSPSTTSSGPPNTALAMFVFLVFYLSPSCI